MVRVMVTFSFMVRFTVKLGLVVRARFMVIFMFYDYWLLVRVNG